MGQEGGRFPCQGSCPEQEAACCCQVHGGWCQVRSQGTHGRHCQVHQGDARGRCCREEADEEVDEEADDIKIPTEETDEDESDKEIEIPAEVENNIKMILSKTECLQLHLFHRNYDTDTFNSIEMCCACEGGTHGCTDITACNYNSSAIFDNGSCTYPENNYDCDGNCPWTETIISYSWDGSNQTENSWIITNENGDVIWEGIYVQIIPYIN